MIWIELAFLVLGSATTEYIFKTQCKVSWDLCISVRSNNMHQSSRLADLFTYVSRKRTTCIFILKRVRVKQRLKHAVPVSICLSLGGEHVLKKTMGSFGWWWGTSKRCESARPACRWGLIYRKVMTAAEVPRHFIPSLGFWGKHSFAGRNVEKPDSSVKA